MSQWPRRKDTSHFQGPSRVDRSGLTERGRASTQEPQSCDQSALSESLHLAAWYGHSPTGQSVPSAGSIRGPCPPHVSKDAATPPEEVCRHINTLYRTKQQHQLHGTSTASSQVVGVAWNSTFLCFYTIIIAQS